ncbi:ABC transporter permease [Candidatus Acetothermia bacterium]|nr:ABC transporter permease [Candidatus Acetothermia bacterium]
MFFELSRLALRNIFRRKLRSALTLVGILIGMTAIVALISLGQGLERAIDQQFAKIGYDLIFVIPGVAGGGQAARSRAIDTRPIEPLADVARVGAMLRLDQAQPVATNGVQGFLTLVGISQGLIPIAPSLLGGFELQQGALFRSSQPEVVLGSATATNFKVQAGDKVTIKEKTFTVAGVLKPTGELQNDSAIYLDLEKLYELTQEPQLVSLVVVKAKPGVDVQHLAQQVEKALADNGTRDITVQTSQQLSEIVGNILRIIQVTLACIAAIALIVGAIGLANTMFMAVLERTREIGVLKSLGAKRRHILSLFLIEASLLGLLGGILGILCGLSLSQTATLIAAQAFSTVHFRASATPELILSALALSMLLGALAGLLPALRASRLNPVEALRYE